MCLDGPLGLQEVEAPRIPRKSAPEGGKVVSSTHQLLLPSKKYPQYSYLLRPSQRQGNSVARKIKSMKDPSDPIGNQTPDLLVEQCLNQQCKSIHILCVQPVCYCLFLQWCGQPEYVTCHRSGSFSGCVSLLLVTCICFFFFLNEVWVNALLTCLHWSWLCGHLKFITWVGNERSFRPTKKFTHGIIFILRHVSVYFTQMYLITSVW